MRAFIPPRVAIAAAPSHWRKLFESFDTPFPLADDASVPELVRALASIDVPPDLFAALDDVCILVTPLGLVAIDEALEGVGQNPPESLVGFEKALWILHKRPASRKFRRALDRAHLRVARRTPRLAQFERVAATPRSHAPLPLAIAALQQLLGATVIDVSGAMDDDGFIRISVLRTAPVASRLSLRKTGPSWGAGLRIAADAIRIDPAAGRIHVETEEATRVRVYADCLGESLYGDAGYFGEKPALTLKLFSILGADGLAAHPLPAEITRVRGVECEWSDGVHAYFKAKGSNALAAYVAHGGQTGGYIAAVVLRLDIVGAPRPIDVALRLPHSITVREARYEPLARKLLSSLGVFSPGAIPDDLWTLAPWIHPRWRWREVLGVAGFEQLVAEGVLEQVATRLVAGEDSRRFGWSYITFPLKDEPGKLYAVADDPALPSIVVSGDEAVMWRLSLSALTKRLQNEFSLTPARVCASTDTFLDLGEKRAKDGVYRLFAVIRSPGATRLNETARAIRKIAKGATAIVLLPEGRGIGGILHEVPLSSAELLATEPVRSKVFAAIEEEFEPDGLLEPWEGAGQGVRLVLDDTTGQAWLDGVLLRLPENEWKMLVAVAKAKAIHTPKLESSIFPGYAAGIARNLAAKVNVRVRSAFKRRGLPLDRDDAKLLGHTREGGWKISVPFEIR